MLFYLWLTLWFSVSSAPGYAGPRPGSGGAGGLRGGLTETTPGTADAGGFQLVKNTNFVIKVIKLSSRVC